jgi:hypothetical protein
MVYYTLDDQHIVGLFEQGLEHVEEREGRDSLPRRPSTGLGTALSMSKGRSSEDGSRAKAERSRS